MGARYAAAVPARRRLLPLAVVTTAAAVTAVALVYGPTSVRLVGIVAFAVVVCGAIVAGYRHELTLRTDAKTTLLTHHAWRHRAQSELGGARAGGAAVLLLDLDAFKAVNDRHGHLAGDAALLAAARRVGDELRASDLVGRFGGEEFVALLPGVSRETAALAADRLRAAIASIRLAELGAQHVDGTPCAHALSASIGIATYPRDGRDLDGLLSAADAAMYAAKAAGGNQAAFADGHAPTTTELR